MKRFTLSLSTIGMVAAIATAMTTTAAFVAPGSAEARQSTRNFTCSAVQDLVDRRGAVVLNTKNNRVYHRFVRDRTFCALVEGTRRITVPTRDGGCRLRICYEPLDRSGFGR